MAIWTFEGLMGSGKTLSAVTFCYLEWKNKGKRIFANNKLNFDHTWFDSEFFVNNIVGEELENAVILLDEAYIYLDARTSSSKLNKLFTYFIVQTRKRNVDLYICTHHIDIVDKRLRRAIDVRGSCRFTKEEPCRRCRGTGIEPKKKQKNGDPIPCTRCLGYGVNGYATTSFTHQHLGISRKVKIHAPAYWDLYDTREIPQLRKSQVKIDPGDL